MSRLIFQSWRIHNPTKKHADYLSDIAEVWEIFQSQVDTDGVPIELQRQAFESWVMMKQMHYLQGYIPH